MIAYLEQLIKMFFGFLKNKFGFYQDNLKQQNKIEKHYEEEIKTKKKYNKHLFWLQITNFTHGFSYYYMSIKLKELVKDGFDFNLVDGLGETLLIKICSYEYIDVRIINTLLENGADVNIKNDKGVSALMAAMRHFSNYNMNAIKLLIVSGADVNAKDIKEWPLLLRAIFPKNNIIVKLLTENGILIDTKCTNDNFKCDMHKDYFCNVTIKLLLQYEENNDIIGKQSGNDYVSILDETINKCGYCSHIMKLFFKYKNTEYSKFEYYDINFIYSYY